MRTNRWPKREIVARRYYRPKGFPRYTGCVELTLECGHSEFRKRSRDPARTARCWNCHLEGLMPEE